MVRGGLMQDIIIYIIVAFTSLWLMKRFFGSRKKTTCGGSCSCPFKGQNTK